jgi:hypothetical protein
MAKHSAAEKVVNPDLLAQAIAKCVSDGDYVAFRSVFLPASPARQESPEKFESPKYMYLQVSKEFQSDREFRDALSLVKQKETWAHIENELRQKRPAQMPSELLMRLADNAVRLGKYTNASQAYEILRVRARIQEEFAKQAEAALDQGNINKAVKGFLIATALEYNYSAFPEPLPSVPNYQTGALALHGSPLERIEDSIGLQPVETFLRIGLAYLLSSAERAAQLETRPLETRIAFFKALVNQIDPNWAEFVQKCRTAMATMREFGERVERSKLENVRAGTGLKGEIEKTLGEDPIRVTRELCGRTIEEGEWWQYLKELAYAHPPAALFVARQTVGEQEILVPRLRTDSPAIMAVGLSA